ncbi:MAG TPA: hypothetical protein VLT45_08900 [Kofleriaceae bacterium]|nr:hypothetical protein [Kofleriaceae bacterium]
MRRLLLVLALALSAAPAGAEPPRHGEHEIIYTRPSGFWTSNRPAPPGQQYKWRLLEIGVAVGLLTGLLLRRTIKKANAERAARANLPDARAFGRKDEPPPSDRPPSP